jgi:uncharacterized protein YndB with AHSA1/START domain
MTEFKTQGGTMTADHQSFTLTRLFNAPRALVFACFSSAEHLSHWWGPKGVEIVNGTLDFRVGGLYHYGMKWPTGGIMWGRFEFREIDSPSRIVFLNSFSDEKASLVRAPFFDGKWPLEMLTILAFEDMPGGKTRFTLTWRPHNATGEEQETFESNHASAGDGWSGSFEKLDAYLATLNKT